MKLSLQNSSLLTELDYYKNQLMIDKMILNRFEKLLLYNEMNEQIDLIDIKDDKLIIITRKLECYSDQKCKRITFHVYNMDIRPPFYWISELYADFVYKNYEFTRRIHIKDFNTKSEYENQGYGSMLLERFIDFSKEQGISEITGTLSDVDEYRPGNKERRNHLYEKCGFNIDNKSIYLKIN